VAGFPLAVSRVEQDLGEEKAVFNPDLFPYNTRPLLAGKPVGPYLVD
jgi:hypothetical protein